MVEPSELIKEYYEEVKDAYPNIDFNTFAKICRFPFKYTKEEMKSGELPEIRLKYFGIFKVYPNRAKFMLGKAEKTLKAGNMTQEKFNQIKEMITKFLKKNEKTD